MADNLAYKPISGNYWPYDNNNTNIAKYGFLYDWQTAKKVCPAGWHLPSDGEWTLLTEHLGGEKVSGTKMKSTSGWNNKGNGTDESGFYGFPGGYRNNKGNFYDIGGAGNWWSASEDFEWNGYGMVSYSVWERELGNYSDNLIKMKGNKPNGFSVRCLKD